MYFVYQHIGKYKKAYLCNFNLLSAFQAPFSLMLPTNGLSTVHAEKTFILAF